MSGTELMEPRGIIQERRMDASCVRTDLHASVFPSVFYILSLACDVCGCTCVVSCNHQDIDRTSTLSTRMLMLVSSVCRVTLDC